MCKTDLGVEEKRGRGPLFSFSSPPCKYSGLLITILQYCPMKDGIERMTYFPLGALCQSTLYAVTAKGTQITYSFLFPFSKHFENEKKRRETSRILSNVRHFILFFKDIK